MKYKLWYSVKNYDDGSAYPDFFTNREEAEKHQIEHNKDGYGWGEDCFGSVELQIRDGRLFLSTSDWCEESKKFLKGVKELNDKEMLY